MVMDFAAFFSGLRESGYTITSPANRDYNCIAWAAGDTLQWWWPVLVPGNDAAFWPEGAPREETMLAFVTAFATLGYVPCEEENLEPGFEKVALFTGADGIPTHAARQLSNGCWTSKLGFLEDIEHSLRGLSGDLHGDVIQVLKRPRPAI